MAAVDSTGETALHAAARGGHACEVVEWLLTAEVGALQLLEARDAFRATAFIVACICGHLESAKVLHRAECDVTAVASNGQTALHAAAQGGHAEVVSGC